VAPSQDEITQLLVAWSNGEQAALEKLMPLVYEELRRRARHYLNGQPDGHTLQTTDLLHEAFLKLAGNPERRWQSRAHFQAVASQAMRHILVDYARSRQAARNNYGMKPRDIEEGAVVSPERAAEFVALDEALTALSQVDFRKSRVVELRYFGGLTVEETAEVLNVAPITVSRDWDMARAWLRREINRR